MHPSAKALHRTAVRSVVSEEAAAADRELVRRFQAGDETAFAEIMLRHRGRIYGLALSKIRNHADAEEITQDTFVRSHRALVLFRGDASLATWLRCIAMNITHNRYRHNVVRRMNTTLSLDCACGEDSHSTFTHLIASDEPGPVREAAVREFSESVTRCLSKLSQPQREIFEMHYRSHLSYDQIALALRVRSGTVKSRIARARKHRRLLLSEAYDQAPTTSAMTWFEPIRRGGELSALSA
jgi:RNA polymerase sigma-70 factor (ECF subfamily)